MTPPAEFDYRSTAPDGDLGRVVESVWYARGTVAYRSERISPTGSCVAIIVLGDALVQVPDYGRGRQVRSSTGLLVGPHVGPIRNMPTGETHAMGIVIRPPGAFAALGVDPAALRGTVLPLEEAWPDTIALRTRLLASQAPADAMELLVAHLRSSVRPLGDDFVRCEKAIALLEQDPTVAIASVARAVGLSHAHLVREFTRLVGITPRALAKLLRMRRLLARMDDPGTDPTSPGWVELASDLGWYDQSHLIRDFKVHTGVTPSQYVEAQQAFGQQGAGEGVGFVPDQEDP